MWNQQARANRVKQKDLNTAFFYKTTSMRNRKNTILRLESKRKSLKTKHALGEPSMSTSRTPSVLRTIVDGLGASRITHIKTRT